MHLGLTQYTACSEGTKFVENAARLGVEGAEPIIGHQKKIPVTAKLMCMIR